MRRTYEKASRARFGISANLEQHADRAVAEDSEGTDPESQGP